MDTVLNRSAPCCFEPRLAQAEAEPQFRARMSAGDGMVGRFEDRQDAGSLGLHSAPPNS